MEKLGTTLKHLLYNSVVKISCLNIPRIYLNTFFKAVLFVFCIYYNKVQH